VVEVAEEAAEEARRAEVGRADAGTREADVAVAGGTRIGDSKMEASMVTEASSTLWAAKGEASSEAVEVTEDGETTDSGRQLTLEAAKEDPEEDTDSEQAARLLFPNVFLVFFLFLFF
jgi:hypothetical protein